MNDYRNKTDDELSYIMRDAHEAAQAMRGHDARAECKYLDQVNDAATELYRRRQAFHAARKAHDLATERAERTRQALMRAEAELDAAEDAAVDSVVAHHQGTAGVAA